MRLGVDAVKSLDANLRLSRRDGAVQIVIAHKPSDMLTVGDAGSQAVAIAKDLLHLCAHEGAPRPGQADRRRTLRPARPAPHGRSASSPAGPPPAKAAPCGSSGPHVRKVADRRAPRSK